MRRRRSWSRRVARGLLAVGTLALLGLAAATTLAAPPVGPPFPEPTAGQRVYDFADVFADQTIERAESISRAVEERTGAQVVVYTQVVGSSPTTAETERRARALVDQWGIGRRGFDDSMVVFFDLDDSRRHGQVQLFAGAGFRNEFLDDQARQQIYEEDMLPLLRVGDLDGAVLAALDRIDAAATPENASRLAFKRQLDAVLGLVLAPLAALLLIGWVGVSWLRYGRDPAYIDDPSIHMPAPPPGLTAATGALVFDGRSSRRAMTTALMDLASRAELEFLPDEPKHGRERIQVRLTDVDPSDARVMLNRRRPIGPAEDFVLRHLRALAPSAGAAIGADELVALGRDAHQFEVILEDHAVDKGWFQQRPGQVMSRWSRVGGLEFLGAVVVGVVGFNLPSSGLVLLGVALGAAGIVTLIWSRAMPARTLPGAMIRAMLAAYQRTLDKTMRQARSMDQVVADAKLDWLETPDQAIVWGVALGLEKQVQDVLERSVEDLEGGVAEPGSRYLPAWYGGTGTPGGGWSGSGLSSSPIPNLGGMMAALGTIGVAPSSSSSGGGGGGGFGGGGSGGGGGAGGGF